MGGAVAVGVALLAVAEATAAVAAVAPALTSVGSVALAKAAVAAAAVSVQVSAAAVAIATEQGHSAATTAGAATAAAAVESRLTAASIASAALRVETGATKVAFLVARATAEVDKESATTAASARSSVLVEERAGRTQRGRATRLPGSGPNKRSLGPAVAVAGKSRRKGLGPAVRPTKTTITAAGTRAVTVQVAADRRTTTSLTLTRVIVTAPGSATAAGALSGEEGDDIQTRMLCVLGPGVTVGGAGIGTPLHADRMMAGRKNLRSRDLLDLSLPRQEERDTLHRTAPASPRVLPGGVVIAAQHDAEGPKATPLP